MLYDIKYAVFLLHLKLLFSHVVMSFKDKEKMDHEKIDQKIACKSV